MAELQNINSFTVRQQIEADLISQINSFTVRQRITELNPPDNLHKDGLYLRWDYTGIADGYRIYKDDILLDEVIDKEFLFTDVGTYYVTAYTSLYESPASNIIEIKLETLQINSIKIGQVESINYLKTETFNFEDAINQRSNVGFSLIAPEGIFVLPVGAKDYGLITAGVTESEDYGGLV